MTFLAIDIGNTRLKWGLYSAAEPGATLLAHGAAFLETVENLAEGDWADLPTPRAMLGCEVAGSAIKARVLEQLGQRWEDLEPSWVVPSAQEAGVVNGYDHPSRLGADRWVSLIGARQRILASGKLRPALVVMIGTAATVDALDETGRFLGGLILPGFGLMLQALEQGTAGLRVPTGEVVSFPTNTSDALMSGGANAIAGAIERMYRKLKRRTGQEPALFMTGGAAVKLAPITDPEFEMADMLIFEGLLAIARQRGL